MFELLAFSNLCIQYEHSLAIFGNEAAVQVLPREVYGLGVSIGKAASYDRNGVARYFHLASKTFFLWQCHCLEVGFR